MKNLIRLLSCLMMMCLLFTSTVIGSSEGCSKGVPTAPFPSTNNRGIDSFNPTCYMTQMDVGREYKIFINEMQFSEEVAENIQEYARTDFSQHPDWGDPTFPPVPNRIAYKCDSDCWGYYTHDHTTHSCKLSAVAVWSNFPYPRKPDYDETLCQVPAGTPGAIEGGSVWEPTYWIPTNYEAEIAVLDTGFPEAEKVYDFNTMWEGVIDGNGNMQETPQLSLRANRGDYNTWAFANQVDSIATEYNVQGQINVDGYTRSGVRESVTLATNTSQIVTQYDTDSSHILTITSWQNVPVVKIRLDDVRFSSNRNKLYDDNGESDFISWSKGLPTIIRSIQKQRGIADTKALTTVTFERPISIEHIETLFSEDEMADLTNIGVTFYNPVNGEKSWLDAKIVNGTHYEDMINTVVRQTPMLTDSEIGLTTVRTWLDLDMIDELNSHSDVYLADASPTYLRLEASESVEVQNIQNNTDASAEDVDMSSWGVDHSQDGVSPLIVPEFIDVSDHSLIEQSPTSVFSKQVISGGEIIKDDTVSSMLITLTVLTIALGKSRLFSKR